MTWTIHRAAIDFGVEPKSLSKWLSQKGHEIKKGAKFTTQQICEAIYDDLAKARAREATANAVAKERDNAIADGELIPFAEHEAWCNAVLLPIRQRLLSLPASQASRCNPADPSFAQASLQQWVDDTLPILRLAIRNTE